PASRQADSGHACSAPKLPAPWLFRCYKHCGGTCNEAGCGHAALVSSLIICSGQSEPGNNGDELSMRTWHSTGPRSGKLRLGSAFTTSAFTRTSCGKPCVIMPKYPPVMWLPSATKITMRVRVPGTGSGCPHMASNEITGTGRPLQDRKSVV